MKKQNSQKDNLRHVTDLPYSMYYDINGKPITDRFLLFHFLILKPKMENTSFSDFGIPIPKWKLGNSSFSVIGFLISEWKSIGRYIQYADPSKMNCWSFFLEELGKALFTSRCDCDITFLAHQPKQHLLNQCSSLNLALINLKSHRKSKHGDRGEGDATAK